MKPWEHSHEIVEKIQKANLNKDALERSLGVVLGILSENSIESACNLMLALRQPSGIDSILAVWKETDIKKHVRFRR